MIGGSAIAQPAGLSYPRAGVVCDSVGKVCYDSYGTSIDADGARHGISPKLFMGKLIDSEFGSAGHPIFAAELGPTSSDLI